MVSQRYEKEIAMPALAAHCREITDLPNHMLAGKVHQLVKLARGLHKRYEAACSYQWATTEKYSKRTGTMEHEAMHLAMDLGLEIEFQSDPRGWPVILR